MMDNAFARRVFRDPNDLDLYREQTAAFRSKFGREMGPDDPFFFDPEADTPRFRSPEDAADVIDRIAMLMAQAGVDPASVYAFKKTRGLFPTAAKWMSVDEQAEWNRALIEYQVILAITREQ